MNLLIDYMTEHSKRAKQPSDIKVDLKPHQLSALYKMQKMDLKGVLKRKTDSGLVKIHTHVGVLGDIAGYGKTTIVLSLIASLKNVEMKTINYTYSYSCGGATAIVREVAEVSGVSDIINTQCSLIVVPNNVYSQWLKEIDQHTSLSYYPVAARGQIQYPEPADYDVILCPASKYNLFVQRYQNYLWNRFIVDEGDSIRIPRMASIRYRFGWFVTATYPRLLYRSQIGLIRNIFRNMPSRLLESITVINDTNFVKHSFQLPSYIEHYVTCLTPAVINAIKDHISKEALDMLNAGDVDGAILKMGGRVESDRDLFKLLKRNLKREIKDNEAKIRYHQEREGGDPRQKEDAIKKLQAENVHKKARIKSIKANIKKIAESNCPICYETLEGPTMVPCCHNIFCTTCLIDWLKGKTICPMCREPLQVKKLVKISDKTIAKEEKKTEPIEKQLPKEKAVIKIIKSKPNGKFVVFSSYDRTFQMVKHQLEISKIPYRVLNGSLERINKTLRLFEEGEVQVILLNARFNGAGINLHFMTDLIIYHELPANLHQQVVGRGQRVGRKGPLHVWKLKHENEYVSS